MAFRSIDVGVVDLGSGRRCGEQAMEPARLPMLGRHWGGAVAPWSMPSAWMARSECLRTPSFSLRPLYRSC